MAIKAYNDNSIDYNDLVTDYCGGPRQIVSIDLWGATFFVEAVAEDYATISEHIKMEEISFVFIIEAVIVHERIGMKKVTYGTDVEKYRPVGVVYELVGYGMPDGNSDGFGTGTGY